MKKIQLKINRITGRQERDLKVSGKPNTHTHIHIHPFMKITSGFRIDFPWANFVGFIGMFKCMCNILYTHKHTIYLWSLAHL